MDTQILSKIIEVAAPNGIFAVLFVPLLFFVLRENSKREGKYQSTIDKLADKFGIVDGISKDISDIKSDIEDLKRR